MSVGLPRRLGRRLLALMAWAGALGFAPGFDAVALAQGQPPDPSLGILISNTRLLAPEPSLLPIADQELVERARALVAAGRPEVAEPILRDLESRHPQDIDVLLARAQVLARTGPGAELLAFLEARARQGAVARALDERPIRAGLWFRLESEGYAGVGRYEEAVARALEAWQRSAEQAGWAKARLATLGAGHEDAVGKALAKASDRNPSRVDLALEVARWEAMAGRARSAASRLERTEAALAKSAEGVDSEPSEGTGRGRLLFQLASGLLARGHGPQADSLLVVLARGKYDSALRAQAAQELFAERRDAPILDLGQLELGDVAAEPNVGEAPSPGDADRGKDRLALLEGVLRSLPANVATLRLGLELGDRYRNAGDTRGAERMANWVQDLAKRVPEAAREPDLAARMELRHGEAALAAGDLETAARRFAAVPRDGGSDGAREEAEFMRCETLFYGAHFDSAAQAYEAFIGAFPASRKVNDALDRIYLIESGNGAPVAGLPEFAEALRLWRAGRGDEALATSQKAESRAGKGPVAAHAALLIASVLEAQGKLADAAAVALAIARDTPEERLAPVALHRAAGLFEKLGDDAQAIAQYEALLVGYPRSWLAPETRRAISELRAREARKAHP